MERETKICQNCKQNFVIESEDFNFYEKIKVPAPTFCPICRAQRRFAFRNERKFFRAKDAFTNEDIFSLWPQESGRKIITQEEWSGDSWSAMDYGVDYDFSRNFFEQIFELYKKIPIFNLNRQFMINSPYSGNATSLKNCYLCFNASNSEDCIYGNAVDDSKDCIDNSHVNQSERCYECFWIRHCYQCYFTIMSWDSRNLYFCRDCGGCNDCFGCANLRSKSYCIFNQQYTKEEYRKKIAEMKLDKISGIVEARKKAREFWNTQIIRHQQGVKNLNSSGSYVTDCKNVKDSFLIRESENLKYCQYMQIPKNKDCYDASVWGTNMELHYETLGSGENSYNLKFCFNCWPACHDMEYCMDIFSSSDCFGCVGLKKKQYCIFNKQYTKEEYEILIEKIKKQMDEIPYIDKKGNIYRYGEFFPIEFSLYGYNNTVAMQHFPLKKEEAEAQGYKWIEVPRGEYKITKQAKDLPDSIFDVDENILKEVIECEECKKAFRVLENEFIFYKREKVPLPTMCHDCRYERRIKDRLGLKLYERSCMCGGEKDKTGRYQNTVKNLNGEKPCTETFITGYAPDRPEIVYCEKCYQQEVY